MIKYFSVKKFLKQIFFLSLIFTSFTQTTLALDPGFYSTISFSINSVGKEGVTYYPYQLVGEYSEDVIRENSIATLTNDGYRSRIYNKYERVSVPPFSVIDVGYYWYNNTLDTVEIDTIRIPLSRQIQQRGDLTKLLLDVGFQEGVTCTNSICRGGKYMDVDGVGLISSEINQLPKPGVPVTQLTLMPTIEITEYEIQYFSEYSSRITLKVRNRTEEYLKKISINYKGAVSKEIDFEAYEERELTVYKECARSDNEINCGTIRIIDPNTKTYCMVYGSNWGLYNNPDSISLFNKIDEQWVVGAQTEPAVESFCIQRIPYSYLTPELTAYIEPEEPEVSQEQYWQELLNIDILPITAVNYSKLTHYLALLKPLGIDTL